MAAAGGIAQGIGSIAGAAISASASKKASKLQAGSAESQLELQSQIFNQTEANQAPFIEGGQLALEALLFELGLGDAPVFGAEEGFRVGQEVFDTREEAEKFLKKVKPITSFSNDLIISPNEREGGFRIAKRGRVPTGDFKSPTGEQFVGGRPAIEEFSEGGTTFQGFQESPGFKFARQQGIDAVDASAAGSGSLQSGSTLQALTEFGQGFASQARGTFLDRLAALVGGGQAAVGQLSRSADSFAQGGSSALAGLGNARSAGVIGASNAFQGGLNSLATSIGSIDFSGFGGGAGAGGGINPDAGASSPLTF